MRQKDCEKKSGRGFLRGTELENLLGFLLFAAVFRRVLGPHLVVALTAHPPPARNAKHPKILFSLFRHPGPLIISLLSVTPAPLKGVYVARSNVVSPKLAVLKSRFPFRNVLSIIELSIYLVSP